MKQKKIGLNIGGHKGQSIVKLVGAGCTQIYCFEPCNRFYNLCEAVAKYNSSDDVSIEVINKALHDDGEFELSLMDDESTLFPITAAGNPTENLPKEMVKGISFKSFVEEKNLKHIDVIKMNCEGSEFKLLQDLIDSGITFNELAVQFHHQEEKRNALVDIPISIKSQEGLSKLE